RPTGTRALWTRTAPAVKVPGYYPSRRGWTDPLSVLANPWVLDPDARPGPPPAELAAVLIQGGVEAAYSGRAKCDASSTLLVHGAAGTGERFMLGDQGDEPLPAPVVDRIRELHETAVARVGRVELEWVFDGAIAWVVQMNAPHAVRAASLGSEVDGWT